MYDYPRGGPQIIKRPTPRRQPSTPKDDDLLFYNRCFWKRIISFVAGCPAQVLGPAFAAAEAADARHSGLLCGPHTGALCLWPGADRLGTHRAGPGCRPTQVRVVRVPGYRHSSRSAVTHQASTRNGGGGGEREREKTAVYSRSAIGVYFYVIVTSKQRPGLVLKLTFAAVRPDAAPAIRRRAACSWMRVGQMALVGVSRFTQCRARKST